MKGQTKKKIQTFTPSAQIAYLYFLCKKDAVVHATEFSSIVEGAVLIASRALNILYDAKLLFYEIGERPAGQRCTKGFLILSI